MVVSVRQPGAGAGREGKTSKNYLKYFPTAGQLLPSKSSLKEDKFDKPE